MVGAGGGSLRRGVYRLLVATILLGVLAGGQGAASAQGPDRVPSRVWSRPTAASALPAAVTALPGPGISVSGAAVASWGSGRLDVFTRGADTGLRHQSFVPGALATWSGAELLGGRLTSQPAVASQAPGRFDVFARGTDGALWTRGFAGSWGPWRSLGGWLTSAPTVASWAPGRLDVFVRGGDGRVWHRGYAGAWSTWQGLDGAVSSAPAVASAGPGSLDLFARDATGALVTRSYAGRWSAWTGLGGRILEEPAAVSAGPAETDVLARGTDAALWARHRSAGVWSPWARLGGILTSGPSATRTGPGALTAFGRGGDNRYWYRSRSGGLWSPWRVVDPALGFRGLGTWVDVFDYAALSPATAAADMRARGVRTLFLQTARFDSATDIVSPTAVGAWLSAAHGAGIRVVGWYSPDYADLTRDVRRTLAVAGYLGPAGQRFDAVGIDIEYPLTVSSPAAWNAAVIRHLALVRAGTTLPLVTIPLPPLLMAAWPAPARWAGFPWAVMRTYADAVAPQSYWTSFTPASRCPTNPQYCAYAYTRDNTLQVRQLTGLPVHVAGGVGDVATLAQVSDYVRAARTAAAIGGSLYDYRTTQVPFWAQLQLLNTP